jgi:pyridoxine 5-phosphate synthase
MTKLSVNINKFATLRNARGGNIPDIIQAAKDCERFGADGITVHPRPDERHIRYQDVFDLKKIVATEFNIEGYPNEKFMDLVLRIKPTQCTLVPDGENVVTSDRGWDTIQHHDLLKKIIKRLTDSGIRVSMFVDPIEQFVEGAKNVGADRIELYTGPFAHDFDSRKKEAIIPYVQAADYANEIGLGVNAGHDLNLKNLQFFKNKIPSLAEVSIGHALICDAIYLGLENTIQLYKRQLL